MSKTVRVYGAAVQCPEASIPELVRRYLDHFKPGPATQENLKDPAWRARVGFDSVMTEEDLESDVF